MRLRSSHFLLPALALCNCAEHPARATTVETHQLVAASTVSLPRQEEVAMPPIPWIDPKVWLEAHGADANEIKSFVSTSSCVERQVGASSEPALVCDQATNVRRMAGKFSMDRTLMRRTVNVVRAGKTVMVLEVPIGLSAVEKESASEPDLVDMIFHIAFDGLSATLDDDPIRPHVPCYEARNTKLTGMHRLASDEEWQTFDRDLVGQVCNTAGEWEWKSDRFVRKVPTSEIN